jgi:lysophospholipase L1-like esterase
MADAVYNLLDCGLEIRLKVECITRDPIGNTNQSESRKACVAASERSKLDIEELQKLHTMCTWCSVRMFISQFITRIEALFDKIPSYSISKEIEKTKWSDIVAGRHLSVCRINPSTAQRIETVITSRPSNYYNKPHEVRTSRTTHLQSTRKGTLKHRDRRPGAVILGDSHARGIASELLQQSNHQISATGYVKPNAGLTELLRTAKSDLNKLSKRDAVIVTGGSNDIGKKELNNNLTSIVKFLDVLQHTNVILTELLVRYDIGASPCINEQIKQYNRKLGKVAKSYKQAKLIRITTDRGYYTKQGLHLNSRGKESMAREILTNLQEKPASHAFPVIHLPWKNNTVEEGEQIIQEGSLNGLLNKVIGTDDCKASSSFVGKSSTTTRTRMETDLKVMSEPNGQQDSEQGPCKVQSKSLRILRNCPKKMKIFYGAEKVEQV